MTRYLVFSGDTYYPGGGWQDFVSAHETLESAHTACAATGDDWAYVVDLHTLKIVE